ncbi:MAG: RluA family pseudouridine synthase [Nitrospirota bacterium]|nr:MAG: RluA family pseudouridine synthase [Nitrospirota bacterium]
MLDKKENIIILGVKPEHEGMRLDRFISDGLKITRSQAQKLIDSGHVSIDEAMAKKNQKVKSGESLRIRITKPEAEGLEPQDIYIDIVHQDEHLIVINKPPGLVMYPAAGHSHDTLMNAVAFHAKEMASVGAPLRPGVVHRLDKDTSGLVVIALRDDSYYSLQKQFKERTITRKYLALVYRTMRNRSGSINAPIGRAISDRKKMSTRTRRAKAALTHYKVIKEFGDASLLELVLATGRTHQIRVHLSSSGHPVLGDRTYGKITHLKAGSRTISVPRQMLHAETLGFVHPYTGQDIFFTSPLPEDMKGVISLLEE